MNTKRISRCCFAEVEAILNEKRIIVEKDRINPDLHYPPPKQEPPEFRYICKKCGKDCDYSYERTE